MSFRQSLACNLSPIPLRLVIGAVFILAGAAKVFHPGLAVTPDNAPALVEMGILTPAQAEAMGIELPPAPLTAPAGQNPPAANPPAAPEPTPDPIRSLRDERRQAPPADEPTDQPTNQPTNQPTDQPTEPPAQTQPADPVDPPAAPPADPADPVDPPADPEAGGGTALAPAFAPGFDPTSPAIRLVQNAPPAGDPAGPLMLKSVHNISLVVYHASRPGSDADGNPTMSLLPAFMGRGTTPATIAWVVALSELIAGTFLILGLLTRISALVIAATMATAAWLTQMGPAIQNGTALLGFLPDLPWHDPRAWTTFFYQLTLLAGGLALVFSGAGALSLDRLLFGPMGRVKTDN